MDAITETAATVVSARAHGALVYDVDGNVLIDFASGLQLPTGHTPDHLLEVLRQSAEMLIALDGAAAISEASLRLAEALCQIALPALGAKLRTLLFRSATEARFALDQVPGIITRRYIDGGWAPCSTAPVASGQFTIADETGVGIGRTGRLFAFEHDPDPGPVGVLLDGFASGFEVAAVIGHQDVIDQVAATFADRSALRIAPNALACTAALSTLAYIQTQNLVMRAAQVGSIIQERMLEWQTQFGVAFSGVGCLWKVTIAHDGAMGSVQPTPSRLYRAIVERGLLVRPEPNGVSLLPPLMIPEEQLHEALNVVESALGALNKASVP
jgi:4-aminobutyrate aminotransferase-like enzyme